MADEHNETEGTQDEGNAEKTFTAAQVAAMVAKEQAKARKEEKDKLYAKLDEYKGQVETLSTKNTQLSTDLEAVKKVAPVTETKVEGTEVKTDPALAKVMDSVTQLADLIKTDRQRADEERRVSAEKARKDQLESYIKTQLAALEDGYIEELIKGTTEEEIDKSIELSVKTYKEIYEAGKGTTTETETTETKSKLPVKVQTSIDGNVNNNGKDTVMPSKLTIAEWKTNGAKLKRQALQNAGLKI